MREGDFNPSEKEILDIIELYVVKQYTLRHISDIYSTNHHMIKRILKRNNIELTRRSSKKPISELKREQGRKFGLKHGASNKGKKASKIHVYKNMKAHLKYDITLEWLMKFEDIEKLKILNKSITREYMKEGFTTEIYQSFIERFYYDKQFNIIYDRWLTDINNEWMRPSLDHIHPRSQGGKLTDLDNLQFLTWLENKCKSTFSSDRWCEIKNNINNYFISC